MPFRYPVALEVTDRRCIVVGGGKIATHKARELVDAGASVVVVAGAFSAELEEMAQEGIVELTRRPYRMGDLEGAFIAIAATDDGAVNAQVHSAGRASGVLVNCVDDIEHCDFAAPSVIRRGDLMVTISTGGKAPALAKRLRIELSERIGPEYEDLVRLLGEVRGEVMPLRKQLDFDTWAGRWHKALEGNLLEIVRSGDHESLKQLVRARLHEEDDTALVRASGTGAKGWVAIVGAGPGDPSLITVRGKKLLDSADVVVHDRLVHPDLVANKTAVYAGKHGGFESTPQESINALLVRLALKGRNVVRLKGGDPFVFGRGAEEAEALAGAGIPYEVVPGPTSAIAALAYAGIPVTDRRVASSIAVVTGHSREKDPDWASLATAVDTIVVLMGMKRLEDIARRMIAGGLPPNTPSAVVENGTLSTQRVVTAPLGALHDRVVAAGLGSPAVVVVGEVVRLRSDIAWFDEETLEPPATASVDP
jgi:uroporphyrin-III C-methyltransferase/precorrin-2 dehydrogenase/sirohydrochlorin ferrochelatase